VRFFKRQDEFVPIFFSEFRRKHLFVTTCIEKQCIWLLKPLSKDIQSRNNATRTGIEPSSHDYDCVKMALEPSLPSYMFSSLPTILV